MPVAGRDAGSNRTTSSGKRKTVRRKKPTGAFGPLTPATKPITDAQKRAHTQTHKATQKVQKRVVVPYVPKLKHPTVKQRGAAQTQVAQSLHRQGVTTKEQVKALPRDQRERVNRATGYARTNAKQRYAAAAVRRGQAAPSQQQLASVGRTGASQAKSGDQHRRLHLPGATIDATALGSALGKRLKGNPAAAFIHGTNKLTRFTAKHGGIPGRALKEAVDLPANTVTSTYLVGKAAVTGHPGKAGKMLVDPVLETVKHPVKSFDEHPLSTVLILRGVKGAAGHSAGKVMRTGALGKTAKQAASTKRASKTLPGTRVEVRRQYSKDPSTKAVQVINERRKARKAVRKGKPAPTEVTRRDINQRVDHDVQAAKLVTTERQARVANDVAELTGFTRKGRRKHGLKKPTAATSLAAQGITTASRTDLANYLREVRGREGKLKGDKLKANRKTQQLIEDALKSHDPQSVQRAAQAYSDYFHKHLEPGVIAHNLVDSTAAEASRLTGARVRRVTRSSQPATRTVRRQATKALKNASIAAERAEAAFQTAKAEARAARTSKGGIPPKQHDALLKAIDNRDRAQAALEQAKAAHHTAVTAHTRAHMTTEPEPVFVSHQPIPPRAAAIPLNRPKVPVKADRTGQAVKGGTLDTHPAKLVEQATGTRRLIDAAEARNRELEDFGYRGNNTANPVKTFNSKKGAEAYAEAKLGKTGHQWEAVKREDGKHILIPKAAAQRLRAHEEKVQTNHPLARAMGAQWRRNVLGFSPRWLFGNQMEGALRSIIAGAGPMSYYTAKKSLDKLTPAEREQALARTVGGGQYSVSDRIAHERNIARDAEDLGTLATAVQKLQATKSVSALSHAYGAYTNFVFRSLNGRLENQFQTAMLGKALRDHPLMGEHVVKLSEQAIRDAANGLRDTNTLVELGKSVDDMYGRYGKFSPGLQEMVANYTPFIAWTLNATNFLYHVMPRDHPVLTGLLASANRSTEGWRKQHGLYLDVFGKTDHQMDAWLQGSIPGKDGSHLRLSRYTPMGLLNADGAPIVGQLKSLVLPQLNEILNNAAGEDWIGADLSKDKNGARDLVAAVTSFLEGQIPLAAQAVKVSGVRLPNMRDTQKISPSAGRRAREQFDPLMYTPAKKDRPRKAKVRKQFDFSGGGQEFDFSGGNSGGFDFSGS